MRLVRGNGGLSGGFGTWGGFGAWSRSHLTKTGSGHLTLTGQGTFDLQDPRILVPGEPKRSLILYRMTRLGLGRMPPIASTVVDEAAVKLVHDWIKQLPK